MNFGGFLRSTGSVTAATSPAPQAQRARLLRRLRVHWTEILVGRITGLKETRRDLPSVEHPGLVRKLWGQRLGVSGIAGLGLKETRGNLPSVGHLGWTLKLWVQRLGVSGVVGLGLCAFAAMFYLSAVLTLEAEQTAILEELETSRVQVQRVGASPSKAPRTPSEQLSDFYAIFPPVKEVPETLRKINQLAERQHLVLQAGNYHVTDDHTGRLIRYEASLPLVGPYPNVRQFLRAVLAEVPSAALEKVDVEKNMTGDAQAKTTVSFTLFLRRDS